MEFREKALSGPAVTKKEELQAGALTMLAQNFGIAEDFGYPLDDRHDLIPWNKCVQARTKIWLSG